jgi:hypothetical protein
VALTSAVRAPGVVTDIPYHPIGRLAAVVAGRLFLAIHNRNNSQKPADHDWAGSANITLKSKLLTKGIGVLQADQWLANMSHGVFPSGIGGMRSRSAIGSPAS